MCKKIQFNCQNLIIPHDVFTTSLTVQAKITLFFGYDYVDVDNQFISKVNWIGCKGP